jgi:hypothetical protein
MQCSSPALPEGTALALCMAVVVVRALCCELALVVLRLMLGRKLQAAQSNATPSVGVLCMVGADVGLQAGAAHSILVITTPVQAPITAVGAGAIWVHEAVHDSINCEQTRRLPGAPYCELAAEAFALLLALAACCRPS